jgi:GNAT superfamily N-acetyltransferase
VNDDIGTLPDLTACWLRGWSLSRGMAYDALDPAGRAWLAHVGSAVRTREYVVVLPSTDEVEQLIAVAGELPGSWLSVVGDQDPGVSALLEPWEQVTRHEVVMTATLADLPRSPATPADGLTIREVASDAASGEGLVGFATVTIDGQTAASGQAAVAGGDVVIDRISTVPAFRRRGLGRVVTAGLASWAAGRGATTGILVASPEGRLLYDSLGWATVAPIATYSA